MKYALIGCGRIPRKAAVMAKGFGMKLVGYDPYLPKEVAEEFGIEMMPMERFQFFCTVTISSIAQATPSRNHHVFLLARFIVHPRLRGLRTTQFVSSGLQ